MTSQAPVLILGAGINGAALARELALNHVGVVVVDNRDLAAGTTAYSTRLIHGGLRYLEYGDFDLVRESLAERTRWLRLAPHLVKPLRLFIPVQNRWGGFGAAVRDFFGLRRRQRSRAAGPRGLWTIRAGLWLYDRYARDRTLPRHRAARLPGGAAPQVDSQRYRWTCAYSDAQICYPERFTLELLLDARQAAAERGVEFHLFTYHRAVLDGRRVELRDVDTSRVSHAFEPAAIVNATGAWVDHTLAGLGVASNPLIGGTKGSHFVTFREDLVALLGGNGIYAEAGDGRPVFLLPFACGVLVGTTDEPFLGDPDTARATPAELKYLMGAVQRVFPQIALSAGDIELVYSGVRPLPASGPSTPAAITRRHWLEEHATAPLPCYSIVGGKLTTCRSLAESAARTILARLGANSVGDSRDRPLPGACAASVAAEMCQGEDRRLSERYGFAQEGITAIRALYGGRAAAVLDAACGKSVSAARLANKLLDGTAYPVAIARYMIDQEWVRRLDDFVERRLMLLYHRPLTRRCLEQLADVLAAANRISADEREQRVAATVERLRERFGKRVR